jgi:lipopolysaccharide export LptBFGC system permease protein LptF
MRFSRTISRYLVGAVVPYFVFSWLLLSVILFVQQAGRFSDIFFSVNIPSNLIWQLTFALVPNVVAFTCPMAALVGVIIGLSKMQGDSELTAIRAAGVGNSQIIAPFVAIGVLLSAFAFFINLYGVPFAARIVRQVAIKTAIYKLESPIEPGVFNSEIAGFTIYVKEGDVAEGSWKKIFIYSDADPSGNMRLITADRGRIDYTDQLSELVLENAVVTTLNLNEGSGKLISEHVGQIRYAVKTRRGELIERLSVTEFSPEELGLVQLSEYASKRDGPEKTEAQILWQRRIILSITPLIFCVLGTSMVLRFGRRGRGFGIFVALLILIAYYLLAFLGEQLSRTGWISVLTGGLLPIIVAAGAFAWLTFSNRVAGPSVAWSYIVEYLPRFSFSPRKITRKNIFVDFTTGLRDFDLIRNLIKFYFLTLGFLASVFIIFTAFELWKFAGTMEGGIWLLLEYLAFLTPFIYIQLSPSAAMIATLATYVIKSRQNEIVTWTSAGQSVYRLLVPSFVLMLALGGVNWLIQETVLPNANAIQDELRARIRSRGVVPSKPKRFWVAEGRRIYSFEIPNASDNDRSLAPLTRQASQLLTFEFADDGELQALYRSPQAIWQNGRVVPLDGIEVITASLGRVAAPSLEDQGFEAESNPFSAVRAKPSHLDTAETKAQIAASESDVERRSFQMALDKKYSTLVLPFIIALFTAPFSLSLSRKGKVVMVGYAVGSWLLFMGVTSSFEQLGLNGLLPSAAAIWGPLVLFAMLGVYLTSRIRT